MCVKSIRIRQIQKRPDTMTKCMVMIAHFYQNCYGKARTDCDILACKKIERLDKHLKLCPKKKTCQICLQFVRLLQLHSICCRAEKCDAIGCKNKLKAILSKLQSLNIKQWWNIYHNLLYKCCQEKPNPNQIVNENLFKNNLKTYCSQLYNFICNCSKINQLWLTLILKILIGLMTNKWLIKNVLNLLWNNLFIFLYSFSRFLSTSNLYFSSIFPSDLRYHHKVLAEEKFALRFSFSFKKKKIKKK
jgi:hypothetical protein